MSSTTINEAREGQLEAALERLVDAAAPMRANPSPSVLHEFYEALRRGRAVLASDPPTNGADLIARERVRQISEEGWTPEHDDSHDHGELAKAASCYIDQRDLGWPFGYQADGPDGHGSIGGPWVRGRPKLTPDDRVRELVKAGALIAAEIDRLQRPSS